ncbi:hypothetical protein [Helicobacter sp. 23-1045]
MTEKRARFCDSHKKTQNLSAKIAESTLDSANSQNLAKFKHPFT